MTHVSGVGVYCAGHRYLMTAPKHRQNGAKGAERATEAYGQRSGAVGNNMLYFFSALSFHKVCFMIWRAAIVGRLFHHLTRNFMLDSAIEGYFRENISM